MIEYKKLLKPEKSVLEFLSRIHLEMPVLWMSDYTFSEEELTEQINDFTEKFEKNLLLIFMATEKGEITGFIINEIKPEQPETLHIISLWTAPAYRGKGVAKTLKIMTEAECKKRAIKEQ